MPPRVDLHQHCTSKLELSVPMSTDRVTEKLSETSLDEDSASMKKKVQIAARVAAARKEQFEEQVKQSGKTIVIAKDTIAEDANVFSITVPVGAKGGDKLKINLPNSDTLDYALPPNAKAGHVISLQKKKSRKKKKETAEAMSVMVPQGAKPGDVLVFKLPNGRKMQIDLPAHAVAGQMLEFRIDKSATQEDYSNGVFITVPPGAKEGNVLRIHDGPAAGRDVRLPAGVEPGDTLKMMPDGGFELTFESVMRKKEREAQLKTMGDGVACLDSSDTSASQNKKKKNKKKNKNKKKGGKKDAGVEIDSIMDWIEK